ncbi:MAG: tetratricopeptide repeat protein [Acidimicrobiales bacterium]
MYVADDLPLPDQLLEAIARRSGGNPLFIRELVAGLAAQAASGAALAEQSDLPTSIERLIRSRIDTLSVPDRALLRDASVFGPEVDLDLLGTVRDDPAAADPQRWRPMAAFAMVDGRTLRFTHDLFRTGAYEGLPYRRRRHLHERVADALAATASDLDELAPVLALHYASADRHDDAWRWAVRSGRRAWAAGEVAEAAEQFQVALRAAPHVRDATGAQATPLDVAEVAEALGDACDRLGRFPQASAAYRQARRAQVDPVRQVRLVRKQGTIEEHAGRYTSSLRWFGRGLGQVGRLLDERPADLDERAASVAQVDLELAYGVTRFYQGKLREAARWCERAASGAEAIGEVALQAQAHLQLEMVYSDLGHPDRARHGDAALALFTELGDDLKLGHLHLNLGVSAYNEGRWDEALRSYARSADAYGRAGDVVGAASTHNNTAEILTDQGRYDEARAELEVARRGYRAAAYAWGTALTTSGLSRLAVRAGDFSTAHALLDTAEQEFATLDSAALVLDTRVRQVECLVAERRGTEALALAELVTAELAAFGSVPLLPAALARLRGWALVLEGRQGDGRAALEQARHLAADEDATFEVLLAVASLVALDRAEGRPPVPDDELAVADGCERLDRAAAARPGRARRRQLAGSAAQLVHVDDGHPAADTATTPPSPGPSAGGWRWGGWCRPATPGRPGSAGSTAGPRHRAPARTPAPRRAAAAGSACPRGSAAPPGGAPIAARPARPGPPAGSGPRPAPTAAAPRTGGGPWRGSRWAPGRPPRRCGSCAPGAS